MWYEATPTLANGTRIIKCRRSGCNNEFTTAERLDRFHANCRSLSADAPTECGAGCHLSRILTWFRLANDASCNCKTNARRMDERGPDWCQKRSCRIIGWLRDAAKARGLPFIEAAARTALALAISRARANVAPGPVAEVEMFGLGEFLKVELPWFTDRGLLKRLDSRGISWAMRRRSRIVQWIEAVAKQSNVELSCESAGAALDSAVCKAKLLYGQQEEPLPMTATVDDPLALFDARGQASTGLKDIWRGCAAFIVCGGPSVRDLPYHKLAERGVLSLGINNVCGMVPVRAMTFNDPAEKFHEGVLADGSIMKLIPKPRLTHKSHTRRRKADGGFELTGRNMPDYPNVWAFERRGWHTPEAFLTDPAATYGNDAKGHAKTGRPRIIFTMFLALRLLHYLGARRVYLLGCDFHMDHAKGLSGNYAFPDDRYADVKDPEQARRDVAGVIDGNNSHYMVANAMLVELRPYLDAAGFHVFNCNPWSRLTAFDCVPFDEALKDCRNGVPEGMLDLNGMYRKGV